MLINKHGHRELHHELVHALHSLHSLDPQAKHPERQQSWISSNLTHTLRELEATCKDAVDFLKREDTFIRNILHKYEQFVKGLSSMEHDKALPEFEHHIIRLEHITEELVKLIDELIKKEAESPIHHLKEIVVKLREYEIESQESAASLKIALKEIGDEYLLLHKMSRDFHSFERNVKSWLR